MLYPNFFFRFIRLDHVISKWINGNNLCVPNRTFFKWLSFIKYEWFLQELEMACFCYLKLNLHSVVCNFLSEFSVFFKLFIYVLKLVSLNFEQKFFFGLHHFFFSGEPFFFPCGMLGGVLSKKHST